MSKTHGSTALKISALERRLSRAERAIARCNERIDALGTDLYTAADMELSERLEKLENNLNELYSFDSPTIKGILERLDKLEKHYHKLPGSVLLMTTKGPIYEPE